MNANDLLHGGSTESPHWRTGGHPSKMRVKIGSDVEGLLALSHLARKQKRQGEVSRGALKAHFIFAHRIEPLTQFSKPTCADGDESLQVKKPS